ncbi:DUF1003 domain-containing protein [Paracoccus sp. S1E-3]|uniref:DUF1003 domain-containing protein n=1 Tax=Paracoccus sp. S1E-3 TaxID=2756130 RepID=UPI002104CEA4|nr:DUF1003 domain-containing protein [Paracoccus sp. S1E-3]
MGENPHSGVMHPAEHKVLDWLQRRRIVVRDTYADFDQRLSFGERMADRVAAFGGSWTFIGVFLAVMLTWALINLVLGKQAPDPYPFIFLNLMLSMLAAVQAPILMMSQNRQASKDRLAAANDYDVNLKSEVAVMGLHDKLDSLRNDNIARLLVQQQEQIEILTRLVQELHDRGDPA